MKRFLIAHWNAEAMKFLHGAIWDAFDDNGEQPKIVDATNKAEALAHAADADFVVVSLNLAAKPKSPVAENLGLELLRVLRDRHPKLPVLVIAPAYQREVADQAEEHEGVLICEDSIRRNLDEEVVSRARTRLKSPPRERNRLNIEINLALNTFKINDEHGNILRPFKGELEVHREQIDQLTDQLIEKVHRNESDWEKLLRRLGSELQDELFKDRTLKFHDAYLLAKEKAQCRDDAVRIEFVVGKREQYSFPLEAILDPDRNEYWMLQVPLFRSVAGEPPRARPLFHGKERHPINCLIINADTHGWVDELHHDFPQMALTKLECDELRKELERQREKLNVGKIRMLSSDDVNGDNSPCWENTQRVLESERWHLIHYAGHSYYDEQAKCGYIFLPEDRSPSPQYITAREFASPMEIPQFVYLSSCESSADDFVFELTNIGIPAVAGFRWGVREDSAFEYSESFYKHLFKERCLEEAFWKARKEIHDNCPTEQNMIWAAAMLVIQTDQ